MIDYKEKYQELLDNNRKLMEELDLVKSRLNNRQTSGGVNGLMQNGSSRTVLDEIFNTISSYLALFNVSEDGRISVIDINDKAAEVEALSRMRS